MYCKYYDVNVIFRSKSIFGFFNIDLARLVYGNAIAIPRFHAIGLGQTLSLCGPVSDSVGREGREFVLPDLLI
jgi:hypothetical protein